ncbi:MAG: carboxylesterase family protein [Clostridiales bacterium]|nr:carboxylesterase family protein [Clostridiales bacterium]
MGLLRAETEYGIIEGTYSGIPEISVFKGIPYASAPLGKLRWMPPVPPRKWTGIYHADQFRAIPSQVEERHPFYAREFYRCRKPMSEDCLYLNIWTPANNLGENLPVMFWIHGGGYKSGYSHEITMDGDAMAKKGVILVTIEYRLGSLGYLAHKELIDHITGACGNYGLLDQIAALKWVRNNIRAFGGDPDNITVFGQSAGALSVVNLITSPLCKNDIAKAIMQSAGGYSGSYDAIKMYKQNEAEQYGEAFLRYLNCSSIDEARSIPADRLVEFERIFIEEIHHEFSFAPIVDGYSQLRSCSELVRNYAYLNIPYMVGATEFENGAFTYLPLPDRKDFVHSIQTRFGVDAEEFLRVIDFENNPDKAIRHGGWDDVLKPAIFAWADHSAKQTDLKSVYLYHFTRKMPGDSAGAYHSAELWYVFQTLHRCWRELTGVDFDLSRVMVSYWTNFAKSGDPNGDGLPEWTPYTKYNRRSMELGERIGMTDYIGNERIRYIVDRILQG